jgi:hypothetical protein
MVGVNRDENGALDTHMRSQLAPTRNNMNSIYRFLPNRDNTFMLFVRSDPIKRAETVICVPN